MTETPRDMRWMGLPPSKCQICGDKIGSLFVNGRLAIGGTWKLMCMTCHGKRGCGFGTNRGILYAKAYDGAFWKVKGTEP